MPELVVAADLAARSRIGRTDGPAPQVESVWIEPIVFEPPSVHVAQPVPPWLHQPVPPAPYPGAFWIAGHWIWQRRWLWAYGLWAAPPGPHWRWVEAEYLPDDDGVWFRAAHWTPDRGRERAPGPVQVRRQAGPDSALAPPPRSEFSLRYVAPRAS